MNLKQRVQKIEKLLSVKNEDNIIDEIVVSFKDMDLNTVDRLTITKEGNKWVEEWEEGLK
jgi:hypothetical protein